MMSARQVCFVCSLASQLFGKYQGCTRSRLTLQQPHSIYCVSPYSPLVLWLFFFLFLVFAHSASSVWHGLDGLAISKSLLAPSVSICMQNPCALLLVLITFTSSPCCCSLEGLPDYIMAQVLSQLSHHDLACASSVCTALRDQARHTVPGLNLHLYPHQVNTICTPIHTR